ncbi:unnamed protein product [Absidia cylindrospora]
MAFDNTTSKAPPSTKCESQSDSDSSLYQPSIRQETPKNKPTQRQSHHRDQHELENARLLESNLEMDGINGDLAVLLNDLSMVKPKQPTYFMPYCA